ncbi:hypothetical protein RvY_04601 [Ramazzottius varieornatus]|uniref:Uncharacterized protein n=1 Tax=Ramazzottius varieornatus TaxID=947166 RepID=A0A1D1UXW0_RAMVA|nr:hypothetical protein RvY_04601 [Ramazzottius varieornatus]
METRRAGFVQYILLRVEIIRQDHLPDGNDIEGRHAEGDYHAAGAGGQEGVLPGAQCQYLERQQTSDLDD